MTTLGFNQPLYILPFDHRGSFQKNMFGWHGKLTPEQTAENRRRQAGHLRCFSKRHSDGRAQK